MTDHIITSEAAASAAADYQFNQLYAAHHDHVRRIVLKYTNMESAHDDVTQLAWLNVMTALRAGRKPLNGRAKGWLGTIAQQTATGERKKSNELNKKEVSIQQEEQELDGAYLHRMMFNNGYVDGPESVLHPLTDSLQGLGRRSRQIMELRYVSGLSAEEVSQALGITRASVDVSTSRSLRILRSSVKNPSAKTAYAR